MGIIIFVLAVLFVVVVVVYLITMLPPQARPFAWILQLAAVIIGILVILMRVWPLTGVAF